MIHHEVAIESIMPEKDLPGPGSYEPPVPGVDVDFLGRISGHFTKKHGDFMAFHQEIHGISPRNIGDFMAFHQETWGLNGFLHGISWNIME